MRLWSSCVASFAGWTIAVLRVRKGSDAHEAAIHYNLLRVVSHQVNFERHRRLPDDRSRGGNRRGIDCARDEFLKREKELTRVGDERPPASGAPLGSHREGGPVRDRGPNTTWRSHDQPRATFTFANPIALPRRLEHRLTVNLPRGLPAPPVITDTGAPVFKGLCVATRRSRVGQGRVARARIFGCAHGGIRFRARASVRAWAEP